MINRLLITTLLTVSYYGFSGLGDGSLPLRPTDIGDGSIPLKMTGEAFNTGNAMTSDSSQRTILQLEKVTLSRASNGCNLTESGSVDDAGEASELEYYQVQGSLQLGNKLYHLVEVCYLPSSGNVVFVGHRTEAQDDSSRSIVTEKMLLSGRILGSSSSGASNRLAGRVKIDPTVNSRMVISLAEEKIPGNVEK
jgi:hypothetical protein